MRGLVYHELSGKWGWCAPVQRVDVSVVTWVAVRKRLFCVLDRDLPFTLLLALDTGRSEPLIATRRFATWEEAKAEKAAIYRKQDELAQRVREVLSGGATGGAGGVKRLV